MTPRKFNLICITALIAVTIVAMAMIEMSPSRSIDIPENLGMLGDAGSNSTMPFGVQPLGLGLALTVVLDMGLMTVGLVILFHDGGPPRRHRLR